MSMAIRFFTATFFIVELLCAAPDVHAKWDICIQGDGLAVTEPDGFSCGSVRPNMGPCYEDWNDAIAVATAYQSKNHKDIYSVRECPTPIPTRTPTVTPTGVREAVVARSQRPAPTASHALYCGCNCCGCSIMGCEPMQHRDGDSCGTLTKITYGWWAQHTMRYLDGKCVVCEKPGKWLQPAQGWGIKTLPAPAPGYTQDCEGGFRNVIQP